MKFTLKPSHYAILDYCPGTYPFPRKKFTPATLSFDELEELEVIIERAVMRYNKQEKKNAIEKPWLAPYRFSEDESEYLINLKEYKRQYLAMLKDNGEKIVWVNFFCHDVGYEEIGKEYVKTARSKGLPEIVILYKHVLRNALVPILTGVVVVIPTLFLGSLIMESFFGIPGLGSYTIDAIQQQDFAIVRVMVFIGTLLYIIGLILTDISYVIVDPRIRLE